MDGAGAAWLSLSAPWQAAIAAAWESWCCRSAGVGAVLTDEGGEVLIVGRNRMGEPSGSRLSGTMMAHAEMDVLSQVAFGTPVTGALYTTFEPCLMCAATILLYKVPDVHYAAADPVFDGLHDWIGTHPFTTDRMPRRHHLGGPFGAFCHVLHLAFLASYPAPDRVLDAHHRLAPQHLDCAGRIVEQGHFRDLAQEGASAEAAADRVWSELPDLSRWHRLRRMGDDDS